MKTLNITYCRSELSSGGTDSPQWLKNWIRFLGSLLLIIFFVFIFAPWLQKKVPAIDTLGKYITESGIDAGAIYYTEVEEVAEGDQGIRNTFRFYLPQK
ncbi:MAG: hypothetical protein JRF02_09620 [Deltaproteobacteria bacterium]|jgi:hypothetical protein|nr:hypothetical protein [Deltaproteobacteria bacterium]